MLHVGAEVLDDDVGVLRELEEDLAALGALQVERDRALVAVQVLEVGAVRGCRRCASPSAPPGGSILITSAPQSASWRTAVGPARCDGEVEHGQVRKR